MILSSLCKSKLEKKKKEKALLNNWMWRIVD
jgi:hypothetical protein